MADSWDTKWGPRRVRRDPPTLAEAIAAAQGLTDDTQAQVEIAAELMGVTAAEAKAEMRRLSPDRRATKLVEAPGRDRASRTVVVERKISRRRLTGFASRPLGGSAEAQRTGQRVR